MVLRSSWACGQLEASAPRVLRPRDWNSMALAAKLHGKLAAAAWLGLAS